MNSNSFTRNPFGKVTGAVLFIGFITAFSPVWSALIKAWLSSDDHSHGLLIIPVFLYMLWHKKDRMTNVNFSPSWWGLVPIVLSLLIYLFGYFSEIVTISALSMILFFFGVILYFGGLPLLRELLFPLCFLILMVPVPAQIYSTMTIPLQLMVTKYSVWIASMLSVPIYYEGNVIVLPERTVQVVQACSGLRSIMTLLTLGAIIGYFTLNSRKFRSLLFLFGVPVAIAVNIVRVVVLVTFLYFWNIDFTKESIHTFLGMGIFFLSLVMMLGLQKALAHWEKSIA